MATLASMPPIDIAQTELAKFGSTWLQNGERLSRTPPQSSGELGRLFDMAVGKALAAMLGGIEIISPNSNSLTPPRPDCVEVGPVRIIGGVRHKISMLVIGPMVFASLSIAKRSTIEIASAKIGRT